MGPTLPVENLRNCYCQFICVSSNTVVHTRIQVVQLLQLVGLELVLFSSWGLFGNTEFFGGGICELGRVRNDCNSREGRRVW